MSPWTLRKICCIYAVRRRMPVVVEINHSQWKMMMHELCYLVHMWDVERTNNSHVKPKSQQNKFEISLLFLGMKEFFQKKKPRQQHKNNFVAPVTAAVCILCMETNSSCWNLPNLPTRHMLFLLNFSYFHSERQNSFHHHLIRPYDSILFSPDDWWSWARHEKSSWKCGED